MRSCASRIGDTPHNATLPGAMPGLTRGQPRVRPFPLARLDDCPIGRASVLERWDLQGGAGARLGRRVAVRFACRGEPAVARYGHDPGPDGLLVVDVLDPPHHRFDAEALDDRLIAGLSDPLPQRG